MSVVEEHLPVLREFVDAVRDRDPDVIQACLHFTPPGTLAEIAAAWIAELLDAQAEQEEVVKSLRLRLAMGDDRDVLTAYRALRRRFDAAEERAEKLRVENVALQHRLEQLNRERLGAA